MASIVDERGYNQSFMPRPAQTLRLRRRAEAIVAALPPPVPGRPRRILELGCGLGEMADTMAALTEAQVTGVDLSEKFITHARATYRRPNLDFLIANLTREIPTTEQQCYDAIVGNGIIHHLYNHLDTVLPALHRWLHPGGRLVFWEPNRWNPYIWAIFTLPPLRRAARLEPDEMAFTAGFIRGHLTRAGFDPVRVVTRDFLLPNTPDALVRPVVAVSDVLDRVPGVNVFAQSLFFTADKPADRGP